MMGADEECHTKPKVSILVPIYNVEKYLDLCLRSIIEQTLSDIEIILINDGSTDSSPEIINQYANMDSRIIVIDKENTGYGNSMNVGLAHATGKYVGIVESDDWIDPNMYERLYDVSEKHQLDVARSEFYYYSTNEVEKNVKSVTDYVKHNEILEPKEEKSVFLQQPSIWANLYLRSFLINNDISFLNTPGASYQDTSFSFKVYASAKRFEMIDDAFYHYRIDGGSSSFQGKSKVYCVCDEYSEIWTYVKKMGIFEEYKSLIPVFQYNGYKWNFNRLDDPFCYEFFNRWHKEFSQLSEENLIDFNCFSSGDRKLINSVLAGMPPAKDVPLVSIVVPVCNMEQYLEKCLDSICDQTLTNIEIICVDDGSTDDSYNILKKYSSVDSRIRVITKKNGGLSSARNAGINVAKSEYIGFVDSDDWVNPDTFERAYNAILENDVDIVCFGTNVTGSSMMDRRDADREYYRVKYSGLVDLTDEVRLNIDVAAWNKLYSLKKIKENNLLFPEGLLYEDYSFYWRYISICTRAFFISDQLYNYLRRDGSIMAGTFNGNARAIEHLKIFPEIYNFISAREISDNRKLTLNSMFLNCFWFAYLNVPPFSKKSVLKLGHKEANNLNLNGDPVIENLRKGNYELVDTRRNYSVVKMAMSKTLSILEKISGCDFSTFRKMLSGTHRNSFDCTDSVATTEWVNRHEIDLGIERWSVIYDCFSDVLMKEWGLDSNESCPIVHIPADKQKIFQRGTELKIVVALRHTDVATIQIPILNNCRAIGGTTIFDGYTLFNISVDINLDEMSIRYLSIIQNTGEDVSKHCRLIRIGTRLY